MEKRADNLEIIKKKHARGSYYEITGAEEFDPDKIFDCGQCFRFDKREDGVISGVYRDSLLDISKTDGGYRIYGADNLTKEELVSFLALDLDYGKIRKDILQKGRSTVIEQAAVTGSGIRILRQDRFEALISFIISQNNNIPRIKKIISALCEKYGEKHISYDGRVYYSFPPPGALLDAGEEGIFALRTGFRSGYIYDAVKRIESGETDLDYIASLPSEEADAELRKIKGVGPKVSSCVLLFGFEKYDRFPVDVWIKKVLEKYFPPDFSPESLGKYRGIAQQYLFYHGRYIGMD